MIPAKAASIDDYGAVLEAMAMSRPEGCTGDCVLFGWACVTLMQGGATRA